MTKSSPVVDLGEIVLGLGGITAGVAVIYLCVCMVIGRPEKVSDRKFFIALGVGLALVVAGLIVRAVG